MQEPTRFILGLGGALLALIAVTAVLVFVAERRGPPHYPADSPEATVVAYVEAVRAADRDRVLALLSTRVRQELEQRERSEFSYDFDADLRGGSESLQQARVRIDRTVTTGERATVTLTVERTSAELQPSFPFPIFGGGTFRYQRTIALVREGGAWKIDELVPYL
ncbi:MAG: nuclear transport factor 2 family protein [Thermomicrobium sp.]|nr:nuclear transport factor 2 family protein [Thermomicrobium sp.]